MRQRPKPRGNRRRRYILRELAPYRPYFFPGLLLLAAVFTMRWWMPGLAPSSPEPKISPQQPAAAETQDPKYQFYTLLKKNQVVVATSTPSRSRQAVRRKTMLQVGVFSTLHNAEARQAYLMQLGLEASIGVWDGGQFRVLLGPYPSRGALRQTRELLLQQGIASLAFTP